MSSKQNNLFSTDLETSGAEFSPCRTWRYSLWRKWSGERQAKSALWICLNPSTADECMDDPTMRRCIGFTRDLGYGGMIVTNIFAYRATDPRDMKAVGDPIGPGNDKAIREAAEVSPIVIAAWGSHGTYRERGAFVLRELLKGIDVHCLGVTKDGQPRHPLYLSKATRPQILKSASR